MSIERWMSWEGGVDLVAMTAEGMTMPNVIVHVARQVSSPMGTSPGGMILWQPDPAVPPLVVGFIGPDVAMGAYFGPNIFAGTPFQGSPVVEAQIAVEINASRASAVVELERYKFEVTMRGLGPMKKIERLPEAPSPFYQQGLEQAAEEVELSVNGKKIPLFLPSQSITGGPAAVVSRCGIYAR